MQHEKYPKGLDTFYEQRFSVNNSSS